MLKKSLLAATCLAAMAGTVSAASIEPIPSTVGPQLAANEAPGTAARESAEAVRASEFIGQTVRNGKGEKVGTVDDLILNRSDKVLYAVVSVGGILGVGDKLVAVPFEELKFGAKDVSGVVVYDVTKEQLKTLPAFTYAAASNGESREQYMRSAETSMDRWKDRISKGASDAKDNAKEMKAGASERIDSAWTKVQDQWTVLKSASAEAWQSAKKKFDSAMSDLEKAWSEATS